jgi:hypothetical protein
VIPLSVIVLGKWSFVGCESLESLVFESGSRLERIDESAFHLSGLRSIVIPANVSFICGSAFVTHSLNSLSVSEDNRYFRVHDSFLEDICGSTICRYFGFYGSIVVPSSVVALGKQSFRDCESLESVTFESCSRLERIDESAFQGSGLKSIVIPCSVVVLGGSSFSGCRSLKSVIFESHSRLKQIGQSAFEWSRLKSIEIPSSVRVLGKVSFYWCKSLESVTFESGSRLEGVDELVFLGSKVLFRLVAESLAASRSRTTTEKTARNGSEKEAANRKP